MKNKIFSIVVIMTILLISISSIALASSFTVGVSAGTTEVKPGDQVVVTVSISNIDKGDKDGVNAVKGTIGFDSNVLTYVSNSAADGWTMQSFNDANSTFAVTRSSADYVTTNQSVMTITFKVKDSVSVSSTNVKITGVEASFGTSADITAAQTVTGADASTTIKINSSSNNNAGGSTQSTTSTTGGTTSNTTGAAKTPTTSVSNPDTSPKTVPQTGISDVILPAVAILGVIAVVSYIRYRKYKNI